jgi:hypothetical protein
MPRLTVPVLTDPPSTVVDALDVPEPLASRRYGERREEPMSASSSRNVGIASLLLGLFAWLGEKFGLITAKVADVMTAASLVTGAIATFG